MSASAATPSAGDPGLVDAGLVDAGLVHAGLVHAGLMDAGRVNSDAVRPRAPGLLLHVDTGRWRAHLERVFTAYGGGLVPVCKGNGYGLGVARLAAEAARLGVGAVAVGTEWELAEVLPVFAGEVLVLTPWHAVTGGPVTAAAPQPRVLRTAAHISAVRLLLTARVRVVLELRTGLGRHGLSDAESAGWRRCSRRVPSSSPAGRCTCRSIAPAARTRCAMSPSGSTGCAGCSCRSTPCGSAISRQRRWRSSGRRFRTWPSVRGSGLTCGWEIGPHCG